MRKKSIDNKNSEDNKKKVNINNEKFIISLIWIILGLLMMYLFYRVFKTFL